jgi:hypothetical protein
MRERRGLLLWLDSATILREPLDGVRAFTRAHGIYVPRGGKSALSRWIHPSTMTYFELADGELAARTRAGGVVGVDTTSAVAQALVSEWARLAQVKECISPAGATRENHRFDQSVLSVLLGRAAATQNLVLTDDEIDVSSARPAREYSTRNRVPSWLPIWLDPLVWRACILVRQLEVLEQRVLSR